MHSDLKTKAIQLRKEGSTYSEILRQIPVAKSTLSEWLHSVSLAKYQQQRLTEKKRTACKKGGEARRRERIERTDRIMKESIQELVKIDTDELKLIGATLYWAEGSKEKTYKPGQPVDFSNSDPRMISVFLKWVNNCLQVEPSRLVFSLYLHQSQEQSTTQQISFWNRIIGVRYNTLERVYLKKNKLASVRRNRGINYHGQLRIVLKNSADLNRKIAGWIEGIYQQCGVV